MLSSHSYHTNKVCVEAAKTPYQNYKSISINHELLERVKKLIKQLGIYHSISEFVSEAVRLRIETLEKTLKTQNQTQSAPPPDNRNSKQPA
jgi:Arc/MetJ-type ribon-helix-helix transcriptional regulator